MNTRVAIIGLGSVGAAILRSFQIKNINVYGYDKYTGIGDFNNCLSAQIILLALPTPFDNIKNEYDKDSIIETLSKMEIANYAGLIVIKSTIEPETINILAQKFPTLNLCHNPEFLTTRTAFEDFHNQKHIVIGKHPRVDDFMIDSLCNFYQLHYPDAKISVCDSLESESMKIFINSFYAVKIQILNEMYLTCQSNGSSFNNIMKLMLDNGWINPMHTNIPGPDGKLSFGGKCFPKDTNALNKYMEKHKVPNKVLHAAILERNEMRNDKGHA